MRIDLDAYIGKGKEKYSQNDEQVTDEQSGIAMKNSDVLNAPIVTIGEPMSFVPMSMDDVATKKDLEGQYQRFKKS